MRTVAALLATAAIALPAPALAADRATVAAGRRVAERECGPCHAIGPRGASRLADAPAFRNLRGRYPPDLFALTIRERMQEVHPRMPRLYLDPDEVAQLLAYWGSLAPAQRASLERVPQKWNPVLRSERAQNIEQEPVSSGQMILSDRNRL